MPINAEKGTAKAHSVDLLRPNTQAVQKPLFLTPNKYDKHPCTFYMGSPLLPWVSNASKRNFSSPEISLQFVLLSSRGIGASFKCNHQHHWQPGGLCFGSHGKRSVSQKNKNENFINQPFLMLSHLFVTQPCKEFLHCCRVTVT